MKLFNTLNKKSEEFKPITANTANIYSCGPTVYGHIHIGNLSSFIFADTLRRVLAAGGMKVEHVMNFTDVDDKTIKRSLEQYPKLSAHEALKRLTSENIDVFLKDMKSIGNDTGAMTFVKATAHIDAMKRHIEKLVKGGFAYVTDDGVYFSIAAYKKSGKVYGQLVDIADSPFSSARIDNDEYDKESAHDFALWKKQKDGEPSWPFNIDGKDLTGRPGWHIECSVMSEETLGIPFDIHTGGIDLIFPHHENEIAQSTAGKDSPLMANFFAHNEHLLIDGRKMSKSLNNFYTLENITSKGFEPLALRLLLLQAHYRKQSNFTWESLESAASRLLNLRAFADLRFQPLKGGIGEDEIDLIKNHIKTALSDDLSTARAFAALANLESMAEPRGISHEAIDAFKDFIGWIDDLFGLNLSKSKDVSKEHKTLLEKRLKARSEKDWAASDKLRDKLEQEGIGVRDGADYYIWYRL